VDSDPPDKPGLADFLAAVLDEAPGAHQSAAGRAAGGPRGDAHRESRADGIRLHLNCLSDTLQPALELLADVALNPAFRPADVERVRGITLTGIEQRRGNPGALASDEVARLLYGPKHPGASRQGARWSR
jgi:predicted Zn-dependent peptidase